MTHKLIVFLYSVYSFFFYYQSPSCKIEENNFGRKYKFPDFNKFHLYVFFYKFNQNDEIEYLFNPNQILSDWSFSSFDEIFP